MFFRNMDRNERELCITAVCIFLLADCIIKLNT